MLHKGPLTISQIQDRVLLASGFMTAAIDRLEKRGLVVRKSTSSDRLARIIELTQEGKRVANEYFEKRARDLKDLMSVLSAKEAGSIRIPQKARTARGAGSLNKRESSQ